VSPFGPSFPPQPVVYPQSSNFAGPLFSYSYELLFPQPLSFHNHPHCPRVWRARLQFSTLCLRVSACPDPVGVANPMFSVVCRLFVLSLRSFPRSHRLFSTACSLFCKNTRVGVPFGLRLTPNIQPRTSAFARGIPLGFRPTSNIQPLTSVLARGLR